MSNIHFGDNVVQRGDHNIGIIKNQDPQVALRELVSLVAILRGQIPEDDRRVVDDSMETIEAGGNGDKGALRRALGNIAGVAAVVGEVGVPVIEAIRKVMAAFGM
jgi:hypothetical protein